MSVMNAICALITAPGEGRRMRKSMRSKGLQLIHGLPELGGWA